ncbi:hypothetical protein [Acanthopleuribacter pedis]|uniref:Uncharacterized protein n=1 Tax=Acanthopleuribacter pedis TaxID=442870 RepID=A0A8J7QSD0_9BACT|nr:hypothetical protein [Acanthopleuribacter pedis]MBO1323510.1 hypothetical protein [Acanthopleuribacter pedis]
MKHMIQPVDGLPHILVSWYHDGFTWAVQQHGRSIVADPAKIPVVHPTRESAYQAALPALGQVLTQVLEDTYGKAFVGTYAADTLQNRPGTTRST